MPTPPLTIDPDDRVVLARVHAKLLDETNCQELHAVVLAAAVERKRPVVIDMAEVKFIPSMAIGTLVTIRKELKAAGQRMVLACVQPTIRKVFEITHMNKVFESCETVDAAVARATQTAPAANP